MVLTGNRTSTTGLLTSRSETQIFDLVSCCLLSHFLSSYVYCNTDPSNDWALREQSQVATRKMIKYLKGHLEKLTRGLVCRHCLVPWYS